MEERFTDLAWTSGDFNKATTSPSQTALNDMMWGWKYHIFPHLNITEKKPSISFKSGTFIHDWFQKILMGQAKIEEAEQHFKTHLEQLELDERHKVKGQFILKHINKFIQNHIDAVKEISKTDKGYEIELPFSDWYDDKYLDTKLNIANEGYIDVVNKQAKIICENKNRLGSVRLSPLKINRKDTNTNRIGDWVYSKSPQIKSPQFTHCIQCSIYSKHFNNEYKPHLIYVTDADYTIFSPDNCWELSPEGLKYFFKKFIQINIRRQELLRTANGSIKKLACLIDVDWSEVRNYKSNFMLENYAEEDMKKLEDFYEKL